MGVLGRSRGEVEGGPRVGVVPDWAGFMDAEEYADFRRLTDHWLRGHRPEFRDIGGGRVRVSLDDGQSLVLGLINLAQICHASSRDHWQDQIADHLGKVLSTAITGPDLSIEHARSMIKVRLHPDDFADLDALPLGRHLAPGVLALPVIDDLQTIRAVIPQDLERWHLPVDELWELGLANIRAQEKPEFAPPERDALGMISSTGFFATTWVLMLEAFLDPVPEHGALVILPHRHALLYQPLVDFAAVSSVPHLLTIAEEEYRQGPGSISPNLYWWRPGSLTLLPARFRGNQLMFAPPEEFLEVLSALAPATVEGRPRRGGRSRARSRAIH